jgi:hypothetical protein
LKQKTCSRLGDDGRALGAIFFRRNLVGLVLGEQLLEFFRLGKNHWQGGGCHGRGDCGCGGHGWWIGRVDFASAVFGDFFLLAGWAFLFTGFMATLSSDISGDPAAGTLAMAAGAAGAATTAVAGAGTATAGLASSSFIFCSSAWRAAA